MDEEEEDDVDKEDDGLPDKEELRNWAKKGGIAIEIPSGWSFAGAAPAKDKSTDNEASPHFLFFFFLPSLTQQYAHCYR